MRPSPLCIFVLLLCASAPPILGQAGSPFGNTPLAPDEFEIVCSCANPSVARSSRMATKATHCKQELSTPELFLDHFGDESGWSMGDVKGIMGQPFRWKWVDTRYTHLSCFEGRIGEGILGSAGGDLGEFVLALAAYEDKSGVELGENSVADVFYGLLAANVQRPFYYHSDRLAHDRLVSNSSANFDIQGPPQDMQGEILGMLVKPNFTGCQHVRMLLENPSVYKVRVALIEDVIRVFFRVLWDKSTSAYHQLRYEMLDGRSSERALVGVRTTADCVEEHTQPLVIPRYCERGEQFCRELYVQHLDAAQMRRGELGAYLVSKLGAQSSKGSFTADELTETISQMGFNWVRITKDLLAPTIPTYTVSLT